MNHLIKLQNKNIVITGGTSGLGKSLAIQLQSIGARVAIVARHQSGLTAVTDQYPAIIAVQGDVACKENIFPMAGEIHARLGDVDVLLNVASYLGQVPLRFFVDTACEDFELALQTNLLGPFRLIKVLVPSMLLKGQGLIVNISSDAAIHPYPTWGGYAVSKAALDHMSRLLDEELKQQGVRFLAIDPGDMNTPMHWAAIPNADPSQLRDPADSARRLIDLIASEDFSHVRRAL
jgi:NAD(P)-dependent dehydrogenase (short-subunit alcohol dehydrogenase family)